MSLGLYLLNQTSVYGYDTFDSCVVVAESAEEAKKITPDRAPQFCETWPTDPNDVDATFLGFVDAHSNFNAGDIVCSSFNAG